MVCAVNFYFTALSDHICAFGPYLYTSIKTWRGPSSQNSFELYRPRDPGKSENAWFLRGRYPGGYPPFEFLKMHLYQYTQKIEHCSNKFDFLTLFCLEGLVPNSVLSGSRGIMSRCGPSLPRLTCASSTLTTAATEISCLRP